MDSIVHDAISAGCSAGLRGDSLFRAVKPVSFENMRARLREVLRNLPEEMSVRELLDEIGG